MSTPAAENSGFDEIQVYYHTRDAVMHSELFTKVSFSPDEQSINSLAKLGFYEKAATVKVPVGLEPSAALEIGYEKTQNVHRSWTLNEGVSVSTQFPRSSMMGDVFVLGGKAHMVATFGFKSMESFDANPTVLKERKHSLDSDGPTF